MANTYSANVRKVDTNATFAGNHNICGLKYIGASNGTAEIRANSSTGVVLWESAGNSNVFDEVKIRSVTGISVVLTNSAEVYIYYK